MKKQNEVKPETNEETQNEVAEVKTRKPKSEQLFFLFVNEKGFVRLNKEAGSMPNFTHGEILSFSSRKSAMYAREFFKSIGLAEEISIFAKIA